MVQLEMTICHSISVRDRQDVFRVTRLSKLLRLVTIVAIYGLQCQAQRGLPLGRRCDLDMKIEWSRELGHEPFAASPLMANLDGDGLMDVVAPLFNGEIYILHGETGQTFKNWPVTLPNSTIHGSPILYDVSGDGLLDLLFTTSQGFIYAIDLDGNILKRWQIPGVFVSKLWMNSSVEVDSTLISQFVSDSSLPDYIHVDPHVLATPVICDLNNDGRHDELVIPVSHYFDPAHYSVIDLPAEVSEDELVNYLVASLLIVNISSFSVMKTIHLEISRVDDERPSFLLASPTIVDLDYTGLSDGVPEIIIGSSGGRVHAIHPNGTFRKGFPLTGAGIDARVVVEDINSDGFLDIFTLDRDEHASLYSASGSLIWRKHLPGGALVNAIVADLQRDGSLEIVITAENGKVHVIDGKTNGPLLNWPRSVGQSLSGGSAVGIFSSQDGLDVMTVSHDELLHVSSGSSSCRFTIHLNQMSLMPVLMADLMPNVGALEVLVSSNDGAIVCVSSPNLTISGSESMDYFNSDSDGPSHFMQSDGQVGLLLDESQLSDHVLHVSESSTLVKFWIIDSRLDGVVSPPYTVSMFVGSLLVDSANYTRPENAQFTLLSPDRPSTVHVTIKLVNGRKQVFSHTFVASFYLRLNRELSWMLYVPFFTSCVCLLILYGYPTADLLPITLLPKTE